MRSLKVLAILALVSFAAPAGSGTVDLPSLAAQLAKVRATHGTNRLRDAGPELTPVKQILRMWIEQQLPPVPGPSGPNGEIYPLYPDDLTDLGVRLSQALDSAGLTCGRLGKPDFRCGGNSTEEENDRGYVDRVRITRFDDDRYLMVVTGVGVRCGFDQSAYLYEQGADHHWHLLMSVEQDRYSEREYEPENFLSIDVSSSGKAWGEPAPPPLVAAIGYHPWCSSNWNMLNTRLWRATRVTPAPAAILNRNDELYTGTDFIAAARLTGHDLLVQFDGKSIDSGVLIRSHVLHYAIGQGDALRRILPIALNPSDFAEEWLTSPWTEASHWLAPKADKEGLAHLHARAYNHNLFGEFDQPPRQCRRDPSLWQVSFAADTDNRGSKARPNYFQVRWLAPYDFALVAVSEHPFPGCDREAAGSPDAGTLFPLQGWTP